MKVKKQKTVALLFIPACLYVQHVCAVPTKARRGHWTPPPEEVQLQAVEPADTGAKNQIQEQQVL